MLVPAIDQVFSTVQNFKTSKSVQKIKVMLKKLTRM